MGGEGSGRRTLTPTVDPDDLPDLGDSEEAIGWFLTVLTRKLARGEIDPRLGDTLNAAAKSRLQALRQSKEFTKIAELRAMVSEVQESLRKSAEYEAAVRTHRTNPPKAVRAAERDAGSD